MKQFNTITTLTASDFTEIISIGQKLHTTQDEATIKSLTAKAKKVGEALVAKQAGFKVTCSKTKVEIKASETTGPICYGSGADVDNLSRSRVQLLVEDMGLYQLHGVTALVVRGQVFEDDKAMGFSADVALMPGQEIRKL